MLRIRAGGHVVAYTGDTDWCETLPRLADGADLFIAEAYSFDKRIPRHLSHATLVAHRDELLAKRVVLTHPGSQTLARRSELSWIRADDGTTIDLGRSRRISAIARARFRATPFNALAGGSLVVAYDSSARGVFVVDAADGRRLGRFPDLVSAITWRSATSLYAFVHNNQQTPGGGRPTT